ncbi:MAG: hypothetical protein JO151_04500 [Verrucomicrobia bacterium]|nr:hypothetical protein [Verrucomicrobiota bacterium]
MRLFAVFGLFVAVAIAKVLIIPTHPVLPNYPNYENINDAGKVATESASNEISLAEPSLPLIEPQRRPTTENLRRFRGDLPDARIPRELENAALAAGLVDPSKIDFTSSYPVSGEATAQIDGRASPPEAARGANSELKFGSLGVLAPASDPPSTRTEPTSASVTSALEPSQIASVPPKQSVETVPDESMPPPTGRENDGGGTHGAMKKNSSRPAARTAIGALGNTAPEERKGLADYPRKDNKLDAQASQRTGDPAPSPVGLTGDLQRFVSDFLRTDQSNNVAEQRRFYADSVHFYGEGDLSWAGVAAATRRFHQQQQTRRSEIAQPAATKGPVNGGFYVVEQPVVWTKASGSQLKRGRSVLRLRVIPIDRGGWKITSIEETNR